MRILWGRASARYSGRIDAELSAGDVVVLFRDPEDGGDGSLLLFDRQKGVQPRNWMPAGSELIREEWTGRRPHLRGEMIVRHRARGEQLEIFWHALLEEQRAPGEMATELSKLGAESEFADLLAQKITTAMPGLEAIGREYRTAVGPIDLLAWDTEEERPVVIEVKRRQITISTAYQAMRYVQALGETKQFRRKASVRLVAPSIARGATEWIERQKMIEFCRLSYEGLRDL